MFSKKRKNLLYLPGREKSAFEKKYIFTRKKKTFAFTRKRKTVFKEKSIFLQLLRQIKKNSFTFTCKRKDCFLRMLLKIK